MPYGAYDRFALPAHLCDAALPTAIALEAAAGDKFVFTVLEPLVVLGFRVMPTVAFDYNVMTTAAKVALDKRVTFGSAGKQLYKKFDPVKCVPGQQLVVEVTVQGAGGTEAGDWVPILITAPAPESTANCANLVASA